MKPGKNARGVKYLGEDLLDFQPGSRKKVLRNKLGIVRVGDMEDAELTAYVNAERTLIQTFTANRRFTLKDLNDIHKAFLGDIYSWAGQYRHVNISKGGFVFASAMAIPDALTNFEKHILSKYTPCKPGDRDSIAEAIAIVHVEFLLIHPYREGNGRTARLLASLMAYQAGLPGLDFGFIGGKGKSFEEYVSAIQDGVNRTYGRMQVLVKRAINRALIQSG